MLSKLLPELKKDIISSNSKISDILRKSKVFAAEVGDKNFMIWVDQELSGYRNNSDLPEYRRVSFESYGNFIGAVMKADHLSIPKTLIHKHIGNPCFIDNGLWEGIASLEALAAEGKTLSRKWPADAIALMQGSVYQGMNMYAAWQDVPSSAVINVIDSIKNRLLNFILDLEELHPELKTQPDEVVNIPKEEFNKTFIANIYGNSNNLALEGGTIQISNVTGDITSLERVLSQNGLSNSLKSAIVQDSTDTHPTFGKSVKKWVSELAVQVGKGVYQVSVDLVIAALKQHFGISN